MTKNHSNDQKFNLFVQSFVFCFYSAYSDIVMYRCKLPSLPRGPGAYSIIFPAVSAVICSQIVLHFSIFCTSYCSNSVFLILTFVPLDLEWSSGCFHRCPDQYAKMSWAGTNLVQIETSKVVRLALPQTTLKFMITLACFPIPNSRRTIRPDWSF